MGETRDWLEANGGPGRYWCKKAQAFIITGSDGNTKRKARERAAETASTEKRK